MSYRGCARHDGAHLDVSGQCVHRGARYAIRVATCAQAGCLARVARRLDLQTGEVALLEAGGDAPHVHAALLDTERLAEGIAAGVVEGFRAARAEQRGGRG